MNNGCPECEKLGEQQLCCRCELGMLAWEAENALRRYVERVEELLKKEKENADK